MENLLKEHAAKTLTAIKLTPLLPTIGLMIVGAMRMPLRQYSVLSLIITLPRSVLFIITGYYFGQAYDTASRYLEQGTALIAVIIVLILGIRFLYEKVTAKVAKFIEEV